MDEKEYELFRKIHKTLTRIASALEMISGCVVSSQREHVADSFQIEGR